MRRLYEAADRFEAQRLKDFLSDNRIEAVVLGDYLAGAAGELPANIFPAVWVVENRDLASATLLLADFLAQPVQAEFKEGWRCPKCAEQVDSAFDICWNCSTPRDESA